MEEMNLDRRLKGARKSIGKTQEQVSKDTGFSREMISYWESGRRVPSIHNLGRLAEYYGLNIAWFTEPALPTIEIAFRSQELTDHDREIIYWARRVLSDYWTMKSLEAEASL